MRVCGELSITDQVHGEEPAIRMAMGRVCAWYNNTISIPV
jgi:hypothetical protein